MFSLISRVRRSDFPKRLFGFAGFVKEQTEWLNGSSSSWSDMLNRNLLGCLVCCREVMKVRRMCQKDG